MDTNINAMLRWERLAQFHLIEVIVLWEGRLTSNHLQTAFSIGRNKASDILQEYQRGAPDNIYHCTQARGYLPGATFEPCFSHGEVHEYLDLLHSNITRNSHFYALQAGQAPIDRLEPITRPVNPGVVRVIMQSVREKQRINVCYRSFTNPDGAERLIAPHTLVSAGGRWHVRAFCEKDRAFKDFMLHRFVSVPEIDSERLEMASPIHDAEWNRMIEMILIPNPALGQEQQQLVSDDYAMGADRQLKVSVRAPLVKYMAVELRLGTSEQTQANPNAHQLALANSDELSGLIL